LIVPEADAVAARELAQRLTQAVGGALPGASGELELVVGVAVCPDHGRDPKSLRAHAEVDRYAARTSGRPIIPLGESWQGT
jgi:GGDEF domain-containing protein